jgi:putative phosphonate metabolism protein
MTKPISHRYAIYFAPTPQSHAWELGCQWLGRSSVTNQTCDQPTIAGLTRAEFAALTRAPRRYGWHATLKAPFSLSQGISEEFLYAAIENLANSISAFEMPSLRVAQLGDFMALTPVGDAEKLNTIAQTCVTEIHHCAAELGVDELQRRRTSRLTPRQDALLVRWGYPYVFEQFRFHCSLTGPLGEFSQSQVAAIEQAAQATFDTLPNWRFETLALFHEPAPGSDFYLLKHFGLAT